MPTNWQDVILAYLHDPPDKALSVHSAGVPGHESRRLTLAKALLGEDVVRQSQFKHRTAQVDVLTSMIERLPMPKTPHVNVKDGELQVVHPLSGKRIPLAVPATTSSLLEFEREQLQKFGKCGDDRTRFHAVWRLWPERFADDFPVLRKLPAETRNPDHTIWNHLDVTAAFQAARSHEAKFALLAFALGPVQQFIEASRSVRDLWSGSMILSWLAFRSMRPVIEELGPTAVIYPALRSIPLVDLWLRNEFRLKDLLPVPEAALRMTPCLPHRFLALVPWGKDGAAAQELASRCQNATCHAWSEIAETVHRELRDRFQSLDSDWDRRWDEQVSGYFQAQVGVAPLDLGNPQESWPEGPGKPASDSEVDLNLAKLIAGQSSFAEAFKGAEQVRELIRAVKENRQNYRQDHAGRWQYQVELATRTLAAQRTIRPVPAAKKTFDGERFPQKCTLLGSYEQMGPDHLGTSREFWQRAVEEISLEGVRLREHEALCAVALVKRFAAPAFLRQQLELQQSDLRFPDTYTVAAAEWLNRAGIDPSLVRQEHREWNGQWLGWNSSRDNLDEPECPASVLEQIKAARRQKGPAPAYYVVLKLDGDDLGGWLRGEKSPVVREVMHPDLVGYYDKLGDTAKAGLDARRPVGPALHAAISTALANFALHAVPAIVAKHHGTTIYSGGDDALILLPTSTALACAKELQEAYTSDWYSINGREYQMMGSRATISGGMVVVHAKDDLRLALHDARAAEDKAKHAGKDALCIRVRRRSGEHTSALCPWSFVPTVIEWVRQFQNGASDRWAYHLYAQRATLSQLPIPAMQAEIRRQISRADEPTPTLIPPERLVRAFDELRGAEMAHPDGAPQRRFPADDQALDAFLTLCHTASFLARGRDQ